MVGCAVCGRGICGGCCGCKVGLPVGPAGRCGSFISFSSIRVEARCVGGDYTGSNKPFTRKSAPQKLFSIVPSSGELKGCDWVPKVSVCSRRGHRAHPVLQSQLPV